VVKVVADLDGLALYFSRAPIPWNRDEYAAGQPTAATAVTAHRHLGIYAYRVGLLRQFVTWPPHALENIEALEQLRAMANGARIHVAEACQYVPPGVDTAEDLEQVRSIVIAQETGER
jgi:3-deoxy-manno-octulosonate cytidylyltransferase (CMP-KDO synthetase)